MIVPSLPGYTFSSSLPLDRDFAMDDIARLFDKLMVGLGFGDGYVGKTISEVDIITRLCFGSSGW